MPVPPPGAIRGYPPRFAPYPVNQGPPVMSPENLELKDRIIKQIEYYFRQVMLLSVYDLLLNLCSADCFAVALGISWCISMPWVHLCLIIEWHHAHLLIFIPFLVMKTFRLIITSFPWWMNKDGFPRKLLLTSKGYISQPELDVLSFALVYLSSVFYTNVLLIIDLFSPLNYRLRRWPWMWSL